MHRCMCPCGQTKESRANVVRECEMYKEERDVQEEEMRQVDEYGMEKFSTLDNTEKLSLS